MNLLIEAMQRGGFFMWPILGAAILAMAIVGDRLYTLSFRAEINAAGFMGEIERLLRGRDLESAIRLCQNQEPRPLAHVVLAGLLRAGQAAEDIRGGIEEAVLEVAPGLNRRVAYLPVLANLATLLGLLGTVQGLILAFSAVSGASPDQKQALLSAGIAVAMYTTAAGLAVAIPTLFLHAVVVARTSRIMDDIDLYATRIANLLCARPREGTPE